ncbi:DUF4329 domain-containing protein [Chryseobacterium wanjuense]
METPGVYPSLTPKRYGYSYDKLNRLTAGYYQNPNNPYSKENTESLGYDLNGNITNLYRTSVVEYGNTTATLIDNLQYIYAGSDNKLTNINDNANNYTGYEGGGQEIHYDINGNMIDMPDKGISIIKYNHLNLPNHLEFSKYSNESVVLDTKYRADGEKLSKTNATTTFGLTGSITSTKIVDYLDGFQYLTTNPGTPPGGGDPEMFASLESARAMEKQAFSLETSNLTNTTLTTTKDPDLQFFPTTEGFYDYKKDQYIYQYKDHLGNIRVSYGRNSAGALEIVDNNDFYPFGMNHLKTGTAYFGQGSYKNYKMQGQELQETGFYAYKWRNYMPDVGRFFNVDPLAEKYPTWAPYVFSGNRVIDARELEGLEPHVLFNTRENAAANFGQQYNGKSILQKREYAAIIYFRVVEGKKYYAYNQPSRGSAHGVTDEEFNQSVPKGTVKSAFAHTHGNDDYGTGNNYDDENFSDADKNHASKLGLDGFLVTPDGSLKYYDVSSDTERTLRTDMPSDPNTIDPRKNNINPVENPNPSSGDYKT